MGDWTSIEVGLVLQGGGALGAYEWGAIEALFDLMDELDRTMPITLRIVTGVSIGAINGACIVGAKGTEADATQDRAAAAQSAVERPEARNAVCWPLPDAIRLAEHFACARHVAVRVARLLRAAPRCLEFSALDQHLRHRAAERDAGQARLLQRDRRQRDGICRYGSRCRVRHAEALPQCGRAREAPAAARRRRRGRAVHAEHIMASGSLAPQFPGPGSARSSIGTAASSTTRRWATRWRRFRKTTGLSPAGRDESLSADRQGAEEFARRRGSRARIELRQSRAAGPRSGAADQQAGAARSRDLARAAGKRTRSTRSSPAGHRGAPLQDRKTVEIDLQTPGEGQAAQSTTRRACATSRLPQSSGAVATASRARRLKSRPRW